jgi:hypothetical protein
MAGAADRGFGNWRTYLEQSARTKKEALYPGMPGAMASQQGGRIWQRKGEGRIAQCHPWL